MNKTVKMSLITFVIITSANAATNYNLSTKTLTIEEENATIDYTGGSENMHVNNIVFKNNITPDNSTLTVTGTLDLHPSDGNTDLVLGNLIVNNENGASLWMGKDWLVPATNTKLTIKKDLTLNNKLSNLSVNTDVNTLKNKDALYMDSNTELIVEGNLTSNNAYLVVDSKLTVKGKSEINNSLLRKATGDINFNELSLNNSDLKTEKKINENSKQTTNNMTINKLSLNSSTIENNATIMNITDILGNNKANNIINNSNTITIRKDASNVTINQNLGNLTIGETNNAKGTINNIDLNNKAGTTNLNNINIISSNINANDTSIKANGINMESGTITTNSGKVEFSGDNTITGTTITGTNPNHINIVGGKDNTLTLKNVTASNSNIGQATGSRNGGITIDGGTYANVNLGTTGGSTTEAIQKLIITNNVNLNGERINADNLTIDNNSNVTTTGNISTNSNVTINDSTVNFNNIVVGKANAKINIGNSTLTSSGGILSNSAKDSTLDITNSKLNLKTIGINGDIIIKDNNANNSLSSDLIITSSKGNVVIDNSTSNANITSTAGSITYTNNSNISGNSTAKTDIIVKDGASISNGTHTATNGKLDLQTNGIISGGTITAQAVDISGNVSGGEIIATNGNANIAGNVSGGELNANDIYIKSGSNVSGGLFTSTNVIDIGELGKDKTNVSGGEFKSNYFKSTNANINGANINTIKADFINSTYNGNSFKSTGDVIIDNNSEINSALDIGGNATISSASKINADITNVKDITISNKDTIINANINASGFVDMSSDATLNADKTIKANKAAVRSANVKGILDIDDSVDLLNANVEKTAKITANNKIQVYMGTINGELESKNSDILLGYGAKSGKNANFITNSGSVILSNKMLDSKYPAPGTQDTNIKGTINANKLLVKDGATLNANSTITTTAEFESGAILGENGIVNTKDIIFNNSEAKENSKMTAENFTAKNHSTIHLTNDSLSAKSTIIDCSITQGGVLNGDNLVIIANGSFVNSSVNSGGKVDVIGGTCGNTTVEGNINTKDLVVRRGANVNGDSTFDSATIDNANISGNLTSTKADGTLTISNGANISGGIVDVKGDITLTNKAQDLGEYNKFQPEPATNNPKTIINSTIANANNVTLGKDTEITGDITKANDINVNNNGEISGDINEANNINVDSGKLTSGTINANNLTTNNGAIIGKDDKTSNITLNEKANLNNSIINANINATKDIIVTSNDIMKPSEINANLTSSNDIKISGTEATTINANLKANNDINIENADINKIDINSGNNIKINSSNIANAIINATNDINLNDTNSKDSKLTSKNSNITISGGEFKGNDSKITTNNGKTTLSNKAKVCSNIDTKDFDLNSGASICGEVNDTNSIIINSTNNAVIDGSTKGTNIGKNVTLITNNLEVQNIDNINSKMENKINANGEFVVRNSTLTSDIKVKGKTSCLKSYDTTLKGEVEADCLYSEGTTFDGEIFAKNVTDTGSVFNNKTTISDGENKLTDSVFKNKLKLDGKGNTLLTHADMTDLINEAISVVLDNIAKFDNITNQNGGSLSINNTDKITGNSITNTGDNSKLKINNAEEISSTINNENNAELSLENIEKISSTITNDTGGKINITDAENISGDITNNAKLNIVNSNINSEIKFDNNKCGTLITKNSKYTNNVEQCNLNASGANKFEKDILVHKHSEITDDFNANVFKTNTLNANEAIIELTGGNTLSSINDKVDNTYENIDNLVPNTSYTLTNSTLKILNAKNNSISISGIRADNLILNNSHIQAQVVTNNLNANDTKFYMYGGGINTNLYNDFSGPIVVNNNAEGSNNEIILSNTNLSALTKNNVPIAIVNGKKDSGYFKVSYKTILANYNTKILHFDEIDDDGVWSLGLSKNKPENVKNDIKSSVNIDEQVWNGIGKINPNDADLVELEYFNPNVVSTVKTIIYSPYYVSKYYIDDIEHRFTYLRNNETNKGFWINTDYNYLETNTNNLKANRVYIGVDNKLDFN
ncbi:beta strand repeat-containing protein, partial [Campylobacter sp. MG1]|uniref:beta strand repeat-containing protein n=1 Tax=Campylobacter sp. MG1 TaxID=2976332 RepID=UPI00226D3401